MATSPILDNLDVLALLRLPDSPGLDRNSIGWLPGEIVDIPKGTNVPVIEYARLLRADESIPAGLEAGFEQLGRLDRESVWCLESDGEIKGVLLACPCHGTAFVWRLSLDPSLGNVSVIRLLRRFLTDIRKRGCVGYLTIVDTSKSVQARLKGIMEKTGGKACGFYELLASPLPKETL